MYTKLPTRDSAVTPYNEALISIVKFLSTDRLGRALRQVSVIGEHLGDAEAKRVRQLQNTNSPLPTAPTDTKFERYLRHEDYL